MQPCPDLHDRLPVLALAHVRSCQTATGGHAALALWPVARGAWAPPRSPGNPRWTQGGPKWPKRACGLPAVPVGPAAAARAPVVRVDKVDTDGLVSNEDVVLAEVWDWNVGREGHRVRGAHFSHLDCLHSFRKVFCCHVNACRGWYASSDGQTPSNCRYAAGVSREESVDFQVTSEH